MTHRLALALFSLLLVLGINLAPAVAQDVPQPTLVVDLRNLPVTGAASVLTSSLTTGNLRGNSLAYRITVVVTGTASVFSVDHGTDVIAGKLNTGTQLSTDCVYTFTVAATEDDAINFVFTTTTTITRLIVEEIKGGVL